MDRGLYEFPAAAVERNQARDNQKIDAGRHATQ